MDSVFEDMLGNTLEAKPELRTELELAASNFVANKTNTTTKPLHSDSIRILISFVNGHITFDFLSGSSGLVVQLFVHLKLNMIVAFRLFSDRHFHNSMTTMLCFVVLNDALPKITRRGHVIFSDISSKVIYLHWSLLVYQYISVYQTFKL